MRQFGLVAACGVLLAGTAANAEIVNVSGSASSSATLDGSTISLPGSWTLEHANTKSGTSFDSSVSIDPTFVSFESGSANAGPYSFTTSTSSVDVTFTNTTGHLLDSPTLQSTIIPAGLGFYIQDRSGGCGGNLYTGCPESLAGYTFSDFTANNAFASDLPLAYSSFDFTISAGEDQLYELSGILALVATDEGWQVQASGLTAASTQLDGFTQVTPLSSLSAVGYAWDSTDISVLLDQALDPGGSTVLTYTATVSSFSRANCIDANTCLVAYSGFGDPIGRGGGVESFAALSLFGPSEQSFDTGGISGITFTPQTFVPFRFSESTGGGSVPEPSTWALLLLGFGSLGVALRRRRALA